jgi:chitin disaccharide deacetylase
MSERVLIVNADDFGASDGVNRGIVEAHTDGIVTSTSLMVDGDGVTGAIDLARSHPALSIGLHWQLDDLDVSEIEAAMRRQLDVFGEMLGRPPTHLDSHHHVHSRPDVLPIAQRVGAPLGVPLRGDGRVAFVGGFYGQWEWEVTDLEHVSPDFLIWILRNEVGPGWTEISCHPGHTGGGFSSAYLAEREVELATLKDPRVRAEIDALGIRLASYADFAARS